jgi:putative phosphoesterase
MRIGVIADTHIRDKEKEIPRKILDEFKNVDMIIHAGDLVNLSIIDILKKSCPDVRAVWGNMDPEGVRKELPDKLIFEAGNHKIAVTHGFGAPGSLIRILSEAFQDEKPDVIIFGHSHEAFNEKIKGVLYFNPGSATDKVFAKFNSYGIIEINGKIEGKIIKL